MFEAVKKQKYIEMNTREQIANLILDIPESSRFYDILKTDIKIAKGKQIVIVYLEN